MVKYCPHRPFAKQQTFLNLRCLEALYGGSAGPGKTDALLMAALQYVHVPGYSALILRRDMSRAGMPGSIMDRAVSWLTGTDARKHDGGKLWTFPGGAKLQFGFIDNPQDRFRYQSSEFQYIGWDEFTEFKLTDDESNPYLFMFNRLRRPTIGPLSEVPIRMRAASNPGNEGHAWVKRRFVTEEALEALRDGQPKVFYAGDDRQRAFVPALMQDNPFLDIPTYLQGMAHLPPITRKRLISGDWSVLENAIIQSDRICRYRMRGQIYNLVMRNGTVVAIDERECYRFATADTAGTTEKKAQEKKGKKTSWSVIGIWDRTPAKIGNFLILRHVWRKRVDFVPLCAGFREIYKEWKCRIRVENKHFGPAVASQLNSESPPIPIELIETGTDKNKVERSAPFQILVEKGQVFLPDGTVEGANAWLSELESEWFSWTGAESDPDDQIDIASYAATTEIMQRQAWGGVVGGVKKPTFF